MVFLKNHSVRQSETVGKYLKGRGQEYVTKRKKAGVLCKPGTFMVEI
jgi:hypothetical protein